MHPKIRANIEMQIAELEFHLFGIEELRRDPALRNPDVQAHIADIRRDRGLSEVDAAAVIFDMVRDFKIGQLENLRAKLSEA